MQQQTAINYPLPKGYDRKYTLRHLIDIKALTGTKKTEQVREISALAGLSPRQMYNYIEQHLTSRKQDLTEDQLKDIAKYFNVSVEELRTNIPNE